MPMSEHAAPHGTERAIQVLERDSRVSKIDVIKLHGPEVRAPPATPGSQSCLEIRPEARRIASQVNVSEVKSSGLHGRRGPTNPVQIVQPTDLHSCVDRTIAGPAKTGIHFNQPDTPVPRVPLAIKRRCRD